MRGGDLIKAVKADEQLVTIAPTIHIMQPLPELLCQRNITPITGISVPAYVRDYAPRFGEAGGKVTKHGKLIFCERAAFISWLMSARTSTAPTASNTNEQLDDVDALARDLGLVPAAPSSRPRRVKR